MSKKLLVCIIGVSSIIFVAVVFAVGFFAARIFYEKGSVQPAVQSSEKEIDKDAVLMEKAIARFEAEEELIKKIKEKGERLKAERKRAEELYDRAERDARSASFIYRKMWKSFDRLVGLCSHERLSETEKGEIKDLYDILSPYFEELIPMKYNRSTWKVEGDFSEETVENAKEKDKKRILEMYKKSLEAAKELREKTFECGRYLSKHGLE